MPKPACCLKKIITIAYEASAVYNVKKEGEGRYQEIRAFTTHKKTKEKLLNTEDAVPTAGIEPATFCLLGRRSTNELSGPFC